MKRVWPAGRLGWRRLAPEAARDAAVSATTGAGCGRGRDGRELRERPRVRAGPSQRRGGVRVGRYEGSLNVTVRRGRFRVTDFDHAIGGSKSGARFGSPGTRKKSARFSPKPSRPGRLVAATA